MVKRRITVQDEQNLINKLNSNIKNHKSCCCAEKVSEAKEALEKEINEYCGTEIVEDSTPNFDNIESDRQRCIKYDAHADKIGYANADPSPVWDNSMVFKDLSPEAIEKLENVIGPVAKSILKRFGHNESVLKDNEECRKAVHSEVSHNWNICPSNLTDYGKKVLEAGRKAGKMVTAGKDSNYEMVNHPTHYNQYDVEVIDMIIRIWGPEAAALWCDITAFKYRMRMGTKPDNSIEQDIKKEQWYLNKSKEIKINYNL